MPHLLLVWCMEHGLSLENVTPPRDYFESLFLCRLISLLHSLTFSPSNMVVAFYWINMVESGMSWSLRLSIHCTMHLSSFYKAEWRVLVTRCILQPPIHNFLYFVAVIIVCTVVVGMLSAHAICLAHSLSKRLIIFIFCSIVLALLSSPQFSSISMKFGC